MFILIGGLCMMAGGLVAISGSAVSGSAVSGSAVSGSAFSGSAVSGSAFLANEADWVGLTRTAAQSMTLPKGPILAGDSEVLAPAEEALDEGLLEPPLEAPMPTFIEDHGETFFDLPAAPNPIIDAWLPDRPACRRARRYYCDGPRWIPEPAGEAAQRAERLEIGSRRHYDRIMSGPGEAPLLAEAGTPQETLLWPVGEGTLGRGFGYVRHGALRSRLHRGVDIPAAVGAQVRGANKGLVIYAGNEVRGYGNLIVVLHGDDTRTLYAHLERSFVFAGEQIARGQIIGLVGRTGLTRAPHLHFEWRRRAVPRNPLSRFVGRPTIETQDRLQREQRSRREAGEVRLAEMRERRERRQERRDHEESSLRSD